jgi:hypothetical protein
LEYLPKIDAFNGGRRVETFLFLKRRHGYIKSKLFLIFSALFFSSQLDSKSMTWLKGKTLFRATTGLAGCGFLLFGYDQV